MKDRRRASVAPIWAEMPKSAGDRGSQSELESPQPVPPVPPPRPYPPATLTQSDLPCIVDKDVGSLEGAGGVGLVAIRAPH